MIFKPRNLPAVLLALLISASAATAAEADSSTIGIAGQSAGPTPFIAKILLQANDLANLDSVRFTIAPKPRSVTRPLSAVYTKRYLAGHGYVDSAAMRITVPVFGLYAGYSNTVKLAYRFTDGSIKRLSINVQTPQSDDAPFTNPTVVQARTRTMNLSYDYILVASSHSNHSPTIIDTDGELRWIGTDGVRNHYCRFYENGIYHFHGTKLVRMELDGTWRVLADYAKESAVSFNHNIDTGKAGIILDVNTTEYIDAVHFEVDPDDGHVIKKWNLGNILRDAMLAGGDDPSGFVRNANGRYNFGAYEDWAHDNAVAYRKSDDSVIISSRENFVICLDYRTGNIKWIFGDTSKQWYQYPSLRKFALTAAPGTIAPVGQHAVSITHDDRLLLFDNGQPSAHHSPPGPNRSYSAARKYAIDLNNKTATEVWTFDNNQTTKSAFRSSVYEDSPNNFLIDYATIPNGDGGAHAEILGLLPSGAKVFHYRYPALGGNAAYRALPLHLTNLQFPFVRAALRENVVEEE